VALDRCSGRVLCATRIILASTSASYSGACAIRCGPLALAATSIASRYSLGAVAPLVDPLRKGRRVHGR
jgi:hypothetical protein